MLLPVALAERSARVKCFSNGLKGKFRLCSCTSHWETLLIDNVVIQILKTAGILKVKTNRYVAGRNSESVLRRARDLNEAGYLTCITYLKAARTEEDARDNVMVYQNVLDKVHNGGWRTSVCVSLSQLAFARNQFLAQELMRQLLIHAVRRDALIWIDTGPNVDTELTLKLANDLHRIPGAQGHVGITVQSDLFRASHDVTVALHEHIPVRLRAGGRSTDQASKLSGGSNRRNNYRRLAERLLTSGNYCCLATRHISLIRYVTEFVATKHLSRDLFEFEIPNGINPPSEIQPGPWQIRVLIPFGPESENYVAQCLLGRDLGPTA
jgi:proline dehydrogenase